MEVHRLIVTLQESVERLELLTGGEIDSITDRHGRPFLLRPAQEQIRLNDAARQSAMLNALPAHIAMLGPDGLIMSVNDAWQDSSPGGPAHAPGHPVGENYVRLCEQARGDGAAEAEQVAAGVRAVLSGAPRYVTQYCCAADGRTAWFLLTVSPLAPESRRGAVVMHMNITEQKKGEEELRRFRTAMDFTADGIFLLSRASMRFVEVNDTACTMSGYTRTELMQLGSSDISDVPACELAGLYDKLIASGTNVRAETRICRKDASWIHVEITRQALRSGEDWIIVAVLRDITELRQAEYRLQHQAHHDGLTGLPNRTLFYEMLGKMLAQAGLNGWLLAVLFLDLDHFKNVNDTLGHSCGDELLVQFSDRLSHCVRVRDTVGRLGGDEFALLVLMPDGNNTAATVANKIREVLRPAFMLGGHEVSMTASIGITMHPDDASSPEELIKYADTAMYRAKQAGRDTFRFFTPQMNVEVLARLDLEIALRKALENDEFVLHYQPKVKTADGRIVGLEALLRWERPGHGLVSPQVFIGVLEETGLIVRAGRWVIAAACRQIGAWLRSEVGPMNVSVNVAGRQFAEGDLAADVIESLRRYAVPPDLLELELTESSLMANTEGTIATLTNLKRLGVQISVDDFGTGYSSLAYLRRFPIDKLKIDIAFIREVTSNPDDAAIVLAILGMARSLKLNVIAEGVETVAQLAFLQRHHCDEVQGYLFSAPLAVAALEPLLLRDLRMQLQKHLVVGDCVAHVGFQLVPGLGARAHLGRVKAHLQCAAALGIVHGHVGGAHQVECAAAVVRVDAHPHGGTDRDVLAVEQQRPVHAGAQAFDHAQREAQRGLFDQHQHELVAAQARHGVAVAHRGLQPARHQPEHFVAGLVAQRVVDLLELVQVHQQHRHQCLVALGRVQRLLQPVPQQVAVGQAGQRIVVDFVLEQRSALLQGRDIVDDADKVADLVLVVAHRRHRQVVPEQFAVLAQVAEHHVDLALGGDGGAQLGALGLVQAGRGHEAAIVADRLGRAVAGDVFERGIDVHDRVVLAGAARDDDAIAGGVQGPLAQAQRFLVPAARRDVQAQAEDVVLVRQPETVDGEQVGRNMPVLGGHVAFELEFAALRQRFLEALPHHVAVLLGEQVGGKGGRQFRAAELGGQFDLPVPKHQLAAAVDDAEVVIPQAHQRFQFQRPHQLALAARRRRRRQQHHAAGRSAPVVLGQQADLVACAAAIGAAQLDLGAVPGACGAQRRSVGIGKRRQQRVGGLVQRLGLAVPEQLLAAGIPALDCAAATDQEGGQVLG
ncbi:hypothetical protein ASC94_10405 [Massilia sp. Root418]|nr:EAL domain-containing protein [Massilia sp. Root418]KQW97190.1 hypothetical protein ASC94_10405 [Massilia sp. Root418]